MKVKQFFINLACGAAIGVAMIIPGVSGGTIAVLLKIYDKLIDAISGLRKNFKTNAAFLLPILLGAVLAIAAMFFPLKWALDRAPLPTITLFAGLMLGSMPKILKDGKTLGFREINFLSVIIPFVAIICICIVKFYSSVGDADLSANMSVGMYFATFGVAALASCALVIPGVSGSMLLMILGFYQPVFGLVSSLGENFLHSACVLLIFAAGIVVGFFTIAKLMKFFLEKFPRGTRWAIIGFVLGSLPALFIVQDYAAFPLDGLQVAAAIILCALGAGVSYVFTEFAEARSEHPIN